MIIGHREEIYDVTSFHSGLDAAIRGVVRVKLSSARLGSEGAVATGWLITDELVVVPDFVAPADEPDNTYTCQRGSETIAAAVVLGGVQRAGTGPALLRLAQPLKGKSLSLASGATDEHEQVFLLHHPRGDPQLHLSIGRLLAADGPWLRYDADTTGGSSGAPVLNIEWTVVGMHTQSGGAQSETATFNQGISLTTMLPPLRESPAWEEIARHHKLADVAAIRVALEESLPAHPATTGGAELLGAAVRWTFDPASFPEDAREKLRPLVADPLAAQWSLQAGARAELLQSAGSLEALQAARGAEPTSHPGQIVVDRILAGPPYTLDDIEERDLPYWLQATRWFAGIAPSLPTPAEVALKLQRLRTRSRLGEIGGEGFRGREEQLDTLREWHGDDATGPMVVSGIGGVGKSALAARFALDLPERTLILWLDFDRADVAPDDPISVLRPLFDQLATQLADFRPPSFDETTSWQAAVSALGPALAPHLQGAPPPLLVLDGFEVAQYGRQHQKIWQVLGELVPQIPGLRVLVSGRAPVSQLELGGRSAESINLEGLAAPVAMEWLREGGIDDERIVARVAEITRGVPLALRLALRWAESGGEVTELPEELPERLVDGFLYQRILDRVMDPALKPVAQDALVLRRLTEEMISAVLFDSSPEQLEAADVFARLTREMALVGEGVEGDATGVALPGAGVLRLRPEVRSATLRLLEVDSAERVRTIDERAAAWYAGQDPEDVTNASELVYHRLRLGDVAGAEQAWRDGCAPLLLYADEELPDEAARAWLRARTLEPSPVDVLASWEHDAHERIRALLGRGAVTSVVAVLAEREERSPASPLTLYDAWSRWSAGDVPGARAVLDATPEPSGPAGRDRAVLAAWLAAEAADRRDADRRLRSVMDVGRWEDRPDPALDALTVQAARIGLTIDLEAELAVTEIQRKYGLELSRSEVLPPDDVVLPYLADLLGGMPVLESTADAVPLPRDAFELEACARELDRARAARSGAPVLSVAEPGDVADEDPWKGSDVAVAERLAELKVDWGADDVDGLRGIALDLAVLGWRRWRLATTSLFLVQASELALLRDLLGDPQRRSVVGALASFATRERGSFMLVHERAGRLIDIVGDLALKLPTAAAPPASDLRLELTARVLALHGMSDAIGRLSEYAPGGVMQAEVLQRVYQPGGWALQNVGLHVLSPDPLEMLVRRVMGFPDTLPLRGN